VYPDLSNVLLGYIRNHEQTDADKKHLLQHILYGMKDADNSKISGIMITKSSHADPGVFLGRHPRFKNSSSLPIWLSQDKWENAFNSWIRPDLKSALVLSQLKKSAGQQHLVFEALLLDVRTPPKNGIWAWVQFAVVTDSSDDTPWVPNYTKEIFGFSTNGSMIGIGESAANELFMDANDQLKLFKYGTTYCEDVGDLDAQELAKLREVYSRAGPDPATGRVYLANKKTGVLDIINLASRAKSTLHVWLGGEIFMGVVKSTSGQMILLGKRFKDFTKGNF
jgi:hypothetical protein